MAKISRATFGALCLLATIVIPKVCFAQEAQASSPTPEASPSASPDAKRTISVNNATLQQQAALNDAIIKASENPVGPVANIPFEGDNNFGYGPYTRYQHVLQIKPFFPIEINPKLTLISRTVFPIVAQPSNASPAVCASASYCASTFGISDVQEQLFFSPKTKPDAIAWGLGPIFAFPTASPSYLGTGKWSGGLDAVLLITPGRFVMGILATQLWSFAGNSHRSNVNSGLFEPFINYNLPGGKFALVSTDEATVNYNAPGNQKWTVPVGGGLTYTFKIDGQLMQLTTQYFTNIVRPLYGAQTDLQFTWKLLFPLKRGSDQYDSDGS